LIVGQAAVGPPTSLHGERANTWIQVERGAAKSLLLAAQSIALTKQALCHWDV